MRPRDACMQTQCNLPSPNQLQAYKDFHSKTTVVPTFAYPTTKIHSRTHRLIRPFNWFEELNVLFSTTEDMTLPLNWAFSCYRTQHPTGVARGRRAARDSRNELPRGRPAAWIDYLRRSLVYVGHAPGGFPAAVTGTITVNEPRAGIHGGRS